MFADRAKIIIRSGKGGDGHVSFRRELYVPNGGPDGGDGGRGGDVIFEVDEGQNTLGEYRHKRKFKAQDGQEGGKKRCHGADGEDIVLKVPEGTVIMEAQSRKVIADMSGENRRQIVLKGGRGGKGNMNADTENGELAKQILDEYYQGFQERNPQLRVFSAHLHMDEATPHLHIDFVPFTTGSKRGLDTRVSLKQALATQGFKGGSRGDTEWSQWIQSEKEQLAAVMERYGIEWEHLGTHEKHLSVLDYKKQEREKEVAALGAKIEQKQIEFDVLSERVLNYDKAKDELSNLEIELDTAPKYQLPEPEKFMTAKAYKTKMAEPVVRKLKQLVKTVLARCFEGWDNYHRLNTANAQLYRTNQRLEKVNERLTEENKILKAENKDYSLLRKVFGRKQIDDLLEQARTVKGRKRDNTRSR